MPGIQRIKVILICLCAVIAPVSAQDATGDVSYDDVRLMLDRLDDELNRADTYINLRHNRIDSLKSLMSKNPESSEILGEIALEYTSFHNDSALINYTRAYESARKSGMDSLAAMHRVRRAALLPLGGFIRESLDEFNAIDTTKMPALSLCVYYNSGRQMYSYLSSFYQAFPAVHAKYDSLAMDAQLKLLGHTPASHPFYFLNSGEREYLLGNYAKAKALLQQLITTIPEENNLYARATHILSDIALKQNKESDHIYFLALSAIADIKGATLEVTSLQDLGAAMYRYGDIKRAHRYLYAALRNAVECHAKTRMLTVAESVPLIESLHEAELATSRRRIYLIMAVMAITLGVLAFLLYLRYRQILTMHKLQYHLEQANRTKEVYISQFLNLCSIYMDKLNQFCNIAERKISTGHVDELYKLTKSGKFIENQSKEFYNVFDNAFLHLYPRFVEKVNALLKPECQLTPSEGELLNTDLRILSLLRLGITESARIAQILNFSVHTVYAYRNRLRNRAIRRDTFESDIQKL